MLAKSVGGGSLEQARAVGNVLAGDVDFATYKAVALACDNGATLPTSPVTGQWFLHTPTGRKVLMMYDGSAWQPVWNMGAATMYVNGTSGTDSQDKGFGTGTNAFATLQFAINQIAGLVSGNISIYRSSGTDTGNIIIQNKNFPGNYTLSIIGTLPPATETGPA